jgi:hypothetical protein
MAEDRFAKSDDLTSEEFLDLLRNPVDWRASGEQMEVTHHHVELEGIGWHLPSSLGVFGIAKRELRNDLF